MSGNYESLRSRSSFLRSPISTSLIFRLNRMKPRKLRVLETTPTSVKVQWEKPLALIDRYILSVSRCHTDGPGLRRQIKVSSGAESAVIYDLEPGSVYNISLVAEKDGEQSLPVTVEADTRSIRPRNLRVVETTRTSVKVQWEKPLALIDRYILSVSPNQTDGPVLRRQIKVSSGEDSAVIDYLALDSVYIISLVAEKDGERSQPVTVEADTTPPNRWSSFFARLFLGENSEGSSFLRRVFLGVPEPRNLRVVKTTLTSVEVQWEKPLGMIDRYNLSASSSQTDGQLREIKVSSGEDSAVIDDLEPGSICNISLVAVKDGERSGPVTVRAATRVPEPRNLRVVKTTLASVEVQWEKPLRMIHRYILSASLRQTDGPVLRRQIKVSSGEDSAVIDDLELGSVYIISLVAVKDGEQSLPVTVEADTRLRRRRSLPQPPNF